jgi:hypothetical protein
MFLFYRRICITLLVPFYKRFSLIMFSFCSLLYCLLFKQLYSYISILNSLLTLPFCTVCILLFNVSFAQVALCNVHLLTYFIFICRWTNIGLMKYMCVCMHACARACALLPEPNPSISRCVTYFSKTHFNVNI